MIIIFFAVNPEKDKIKIEISGDGSKVSRISNFVVLSFSVITDNLSLLSKDQKAFCIVNCKGIFPGILSKGYLQINTWAFPYCPGHHLSQCRKDINSFHYILISNKGIWNDQYDRK
jgi:hypothetical protein